MYDAAETISETHWQPFVWLGIEHPFFMIEKDPIIYTWIILGILVIALLPTRWLLRKKFSIPRYLILSFTETFVDIVKQALGYFSFNHFVFITALFIFIFTSNTIALVPWMKEPTENINTTLALGIISFIYIQVYGIKAHGIKEYIKEYFSPIFLMFPLHVIGKLASIISISFRLFGNIFGGGIICQTYFNTIQTSPLLQTIGLFTGLNFLILMFFVMFEGFLQAFVFTMLSATYLSIAVQKEEKETK